MHKKYIVFKISIIIFVSLFCLQLYAQTWDIPADKKAKNSYIPFTGVTAKEGEAIFTKNCMSCHGNPGKGNSLKTLKPVPPDLAGAITQQRTDGDLFYIVSTGRAIMPSFKNVFSDDDRWKVISYIRSFNKQYVQVLSKFDPRKSKLVKINVSFDSQTYLIRVVVKANEKTGTVSLKDDEVELFANRYFGRLQIDKSLHTNQDGVAFFQFPKDLPGDKAGIVGLTVKVSDDNYGEIEYQQKLNIGIPTDNPPLTQKRAIWNVVTKAPLWIILTYTSCVLFVGLFLLYILYSLWKLKKAGTT
ncbi:MAG: cytochrome c [Bacteroidota bacterium]|nr:cytochrome c [Bacteroidota bacterium]